MNTRDSFDLQFAAKMRHLRKKSGLSLREVAELAKCSQGTISKIERGQSSPSINILHRLAKAYNVNMAELFQTSPNLVGFVMSASERPRLAPSESHSSHGVKLESLLPITYEGVFQAHLHTIEADAGSDGLIEHEGEEFGLVLEGTVELTVGERTRQVTKGDSFFFESDQPHGYRNCGSDRAVVIWVNTPPTY